MSAIVEGLASKLEERGYELRGKVKIVGSATSYRDYAQKGLSTVEKEEIFKRSNEAAINDFYSLHLPINSITFTTKDGVKLKYRNEKEKWMLSQIETGSSMFAVSKIREIQEISI